ncbi:uncharacterized protein LOC121504409 isoform X2 [Cheilinus undulatus]|uniref:uncharacterized protein LOC121504409 isoform X2 n=1 Tax=Cheilinus undulatus TaxID=241271 RepID=UPI001BD5C968|nr:uncharacterized protein LOC121504409 isoform X2 [Cheilinus undulatus]
MKSPGPLEKRLRFIVVLVQVVLVSVGARSDPGWTAHLLCSCLQDKDILSMMITTPDLPENEYCFFIQDGREDTTNQNAAFIERLSWTGGPNVTMKEVTSSDAVPYTCKGRYKGPGDDPKDTMCPANLTVQVPAVYGQNAILPCWCLQGSFLGMNITRPGILNGKYCVFIRDGHKDPTNQDAACAGRMTWTGGSNVTMKNVTSRDEALYTCHGSFEDHDGGIKETWCSTYLTVQGGPAPRPPGPPGDISQDLLKAIGLTVPTILTTVGIVVVVIIVIIVKRKSLINFLKKRRRRHQPVGDHVKENDTDDDGDDGNEDEKLVFA